jgi:hypothetical protein
VELLMVEDDTFFAWLDGELSPEEAARVEAEVAADPRLSRLADGHRAMTTGLRHAFAQVEAKPVPDWLRRPIDGDEQVVDLAEVRSVHAARRAPPIWAQMAALAATLAVGVFAGNVMSGMFTAGPSSPIEAEAGRLVASAELENALYARLASAPAELGPRIGLTFRDKSGAICRTFEDRTASGLACREGGDWRIRSLFQAPEGQATDYRMASGPDPQLMEAVDASIDGEPFDAAEEKAAAERGWK